MYPKEQIYPIYSLRWQIELEFKNWKSILEIDESGRKLKKERIEAHFYGKLINIGLASFFWVKTIILPFLPIKSIIFNKIVPFTLFSKTTVYESKIALLKMTHLSDFINV